MDHPLLDLSRRRLLSSAVWCVILSACAIEAAGPSDPPEPSVSAPSITEFQIPRAGAFPHDPALAPNGIVWYTDQLNCFIGRLDPGTGAITDIATPTANSGPHGIDVAPDGMVYYTAQTRGIIGRVDPRTNVITEFRLPADATSPHTLIVFRGKVWFTARATTRTASSIPLPAWCAPSAARRRAHPPTASAPLPTARSGSRSSGPTSWGASIP